MSTLRSYFDLEAAECLRRMDALLREKTPVDGGELHRLARALRGTANLAREDHVYRAALGFESAARALAQASPDWDEPTRSSMAASLAELAALVTAAEQDEARERRVASVLERCIPLAEATAVAGSAPTGDRLERDRRRFRDYVAREAGAIAEVLDESMAAFVRDPMDRGPLSAVLRRHRALLGAARLDDVRIVADTLRAVEDIAGVIARLNAPVKKEWLDVFRCARDVLRGAAESLSRGEEPRSSTALSRLRTLHEELLDRYGSLEPAAPPPVRPASGAGAPSPPANAVPEPAAAETAIDVLCYRGPAALRRALELRPRVEAALRDEAGSREVLDELFDLIRLGIE